MPKIHYVPLEHLDKRYTKIMDQQLEREFIKQWKEYEKVLWELLTTEIENGAFLDSEWTNYYKFTQLQNICKLFREWKVENGDVFFFSDLWFPGIEALKYMAYFREIDIKIKWMIHAGSFTETDFVRWMEDWAQWIEKWRFQMFSKVFLGSDTIKRELIEKGRVTNFKTLAKTWLPFNTNDLYELAQPLPWNEKENNVIFTGRLDDEKQPWLFDELKRRTEDLWFNFIKTLEQNLSKKEYLELLAKSKFVFSSALQENFWYGMLEWAAYNCNLILPNRLVYPEFYWKECLYNNMDQAEAIMREWKDKPMDTVKYATPHNDNVSKIVDLI